jgi:hypothetical protein
MKRSAAKEASAKSEKEKQVYTFICNFKPARPALMRCFLSLVLDNTTKYTPARPVLPQGKRTSAVRNGVFESCSWLLPFSKSASKEKCVC